MFYYVYVLFSKKNQGIYIGFTDDLRRRFKEHMRGSVAATRDRRPLELIYFEGYRDKLDAMHREKYLKTGWGRNYLKKTLTNYRSKI